MMPKGVITIGYSPFLGALVLEALAVSGKPDWERQWHSSGHGNGACWLFSSDLLAFTPGCVELSTQARKFSGSLKHSVAHASAL